MGTRAKPEIQAWRPLWGTIPAVSAYLTDRSTAIGPLENCHGLNLTPGCLVCRMR